MKDGDSRLCGRRSSVPAIPGEAGFTQQFYTGGDNPFDEQLPIYTWSDTLMTTCTSDIYYVWMEDSDSPFRGWR